MNIQEVTHAEMARAFVALSDKINGTFPAYIKPLDKDVEGVFHAETNRVFKQGKVCRWLLQSDGEYIGRIAAFVNDKTVNKDNDQPTGGIGFFECIDNKEAAFLLFDTAKDWLEKQGMEAMDGPVNFGERDRWWGLLIDGFDREPNYCCNFNPPYYQAFFEEYGFQTYFNQFTFDRPIRNELSERIKEKAEQVAKDSRYTFRHMEKKHMWKYTEDFRKVYNAAWGKHSGVPQLSEKQARSLMKKMKPLLDERVIWFAYYDDEPVAFFLSLPEFNQIVKRLNGKLNVLGKLKFLYYKMAKTNRKLLGLVFGVAPSHQGKGVEGALIDKVRYFLMGYDRYDSLEMNWIGDFNPKMLKVVEQVGGIRCKTHRTYRKLFDETKPFKRAEMKG